METKYIIENRIKELKSKVSYKDGLLVDKVTQIYEDEKRRLQEEDMRIRREMNIMREVRDEVTKEMQESGLFDPKFKQTFVEILKRVEDKYPKEP